MSIKYVVFDWDGTLADTYPVISAAYDYTFDTLGLPRIPYDEVKRITSTLQNKDTLAASSANASRKPPTLTTASSANTTPPLWKQCPVPAAFWNTAGNTILPAS